MTTVPFRQFYRGGGGPTPLQQLSVTQQDYDRIASHIPELDDWEYDNVVSNLAKQRIKRIYTFEDDSIDQAAGAAASTNGERFTGRGVIATPDATTGRSTILTKNSTLAGNFSSLILGGIPAGSAARPQVRAAENWWFKVLISQTTAPVGGTQEYYTGFEVNGGGTGLRDGIYFLSANAGAWTLVCRNGGVQTTLGMGVSPSTTLLLLELRIKLDGGAVEGWLNGKYVGTVRATIPTALLYITPVLQDNRAATVTTAGIIRCYGFGIAGDLIP